MIFATVIKAANPRPKYTDQLTKINPKQHWGKQQGFTLIELMISLVLGLLISAAVVQVYAVSVKTSVVQSSGSDIMDANIFGLQRFERRVRLANLGLADAATGDRLGSGVVVSLANLTGITLSGGAAVPIELLTRNDGDTVGTDPQWTGATHTNRASDQLTIQYRAPENITDCEGQLALGPRPVTIQGTTQIIDGQVIIERYFLRDVNGKLALVCDAGRYITETIDNYAQQGDPTVPISVFAAPDVINGFGDEGHVLVDNVDDFQVLLGITTPDGIRYVTSSQYLADDYALPAPSIETIPLLQLPIVAVKVGLINAGDTPLPSSDTGQTTFNLLGQQTIIDTSELQNIIRHAYESNIALRNANQ